MIQKKKKILLVEFQKKDIGLLYVMNFSPVTFFLKQYMIEILLVEVEIQRSELRFLEFDFFGSKYSISIPVFLGFYIFFEIFGNF